MGNQVRIEIDGLQPIRLDRDDALALAESLWRVGELDNVRHAITLSAALLEARTASTALVVHSVQLPALREAMRRLADRSTLSTELMALQRGLDD